MPQLPPIFQIPPERPPIRPVPTSPDITGTNGDDTLNGNGFGQTIHGLKGNDKIAGFGGADTLFGDEGDDSLDGGPDNSSEQVQNALHGGLGRDTYFVHKTTDTVFEENEPGVQDTVVADNAFYKLPSGQQVEQLIMDPSAALAGTSIIGKGNELGNFIQAQNGKQRGVTETLLLGFAGDDEIRGDTSIPNTIQGGNGNDTIFGGAGGDDLSGVGANSDGSLGADERDVIHINGGSTVPVHLTLGDERGSYYMGTGLARVTGVKGLFTQLNLAGSRNDYTATVFRDADTQNNPAFDIKIQNHGNTIAILENVGNFDGTPLLSDGDVNTAQFFGNSLLQSAHYIPINQPVKLGTNSNNVIQGTNASGIVDGRGGDDKLFAKGGNDIVVGGAGNDLLNGGDGDDLLWGGKGFNWAVGGKGADTFVLARNSGIEWIKDYEAGVDHIGFIGNVASANISFAAARGGGTIVRAGNEKIAFLQGVNANQMSLNDLVQVGMTKQNGMSVPTILG